MVPDPASARRIAEITELELRMLTAPEAPIVLVAGKAGGLASSVAPGNPYLGIMLPYTPLHHILLRDLGSPVVATSGNLSDEPLCIDEDEALDRLGGIADVFLIHDRPIHRHVDDSIVRVMAGRAMVLRRARGYAPLPVTVTRDLPAVIAVGAHLKNTVAAAKGRDVFISQHLGDLETEASLRAFRREVEEFRILFDVSPTRVVSDSIPTIFPARKPPRWDFRVSRSSITTLTSVPAWPTTSWTGRCSGSRGTAPDSGPTEPCGEGVPAYDG